LRVIPVFLAGTLLSFHRADAKSVRLESLETITLASSEIALGRVTSVHDSWLPAPATFGNRTVDYVVLRNLRGKTRYSGSFVLFVHRTEPPPLVGDSLLVFDGYRMRSEPGRPHALKVNDAFDLSRGGRPLRWPALSSDFRVIRQSDSIMALVERRLNWIERRRPLGDDRRLTLQDFAEGRGLLEDPMPEDSEAERATDYGSINSLVHPADASLLPSLMRATRDALPERRARAAGSLAWYRRDSVVTRLKEMLSDPGVSLVRYARSGTKEDSVWVPVVHHAAVSALRALGAGTTEGPKP